MSAPIPRLIQSLLGCIALVLLAPGCTTFASLNRELPQERAAPATRARLAVDGSRGNPKVLMFLALSGGGSRAAYLSGATMLRMQSVFPDLDLLREVDAMSSVSGGSLAAAFYGLTRDETLASDVAARSLRPALQPGAAKPALAKLRIDSDGRTLRCAAPLEDGERELVARLLAPDAKLTAAVADLCAQAALTRLRGWNEEAVKRGMSRDYLLRWLGNWFWPTNIVRYWFTAFDRSDIMAQTLADNLFDSPVIGTDLSFADLNPTRPFLILNATNATEKVVRDNPVPQEYAFGTVFTFTDEEFRTRLGSDLSSFKVANAVMASSAFPLVFPMMTLEDFRPPRHPSCRNAGGAGSDLCRRHFLHLFDGGNSDNLGLKSVRRALLQMAVDGHLQQYDEVIVFLVDAFTLPSGVRRTDADPRSALSLLLDTNVVDAVDSLLQANRANLIDEFRSAVLQARESDCEADSRALPEDLCREIALLPDRRLDLRSKLFFYHFGFDDVGRIDPALKDQLDHIPTSFRISDEDVALIDRAVAAVLRPDNPCLQQMAAILRGDPVKVDEANAICRGSDVVPPKQSNARQGTATGAATNDLDTLSGSGALATH